MTARQRVATGALLALGSAAFAIGRRQAQDRDRDDADMVEIPIE